MNFINLKYHSTKFLNFIKNIQFYKEFILEAVKNDGNTLIYASKELKDDKKLF